jgi:diamine N-acetyltransferase
MINNKNIRLRALEPEDLEFLYHIENDPEIWAYSDTQIPFSKYVLENYIANAYKDIYEAKQIRFVIENTSQERVGLIDLFEFDPAHLRAGIGIVIVAEHRQKGYALEAITTIAAYAKEHLRLHQLYANIQEYNTESIALFERAGFELSGRKKDWNYNNGQYTAELLFQRIL